MTAVDTNVLLRLITRDDREQLEKARVLFETETCFIPDTVLLETAWVLRSSYEASRDVIHTELMVVLGLPNVRVADPDRIGRVLEWYATGMDIGGAFHLAASQHADTFKTFDRHLIRNAPQKGRCRVSPLR